MNNTGAASNGIHFKTMQILKNKMKQFHTLWINYNQPMPSMPTFPGQVTKPSVLVVADEIFTMGDKPLM